MAKRRGGRRPAEARLWVFAEYPVRTDHLLIPVLAASRDEAIRIAATDPKRIGKPLTAKQVAGHPGVTDGERDFIIFDNPEAFARFLREQMIEPN